MVRAFVGTFNDDEGVRHRLAMNLPLLYRTAQHRIPITVEERRYSHLTATDSGRHA